MNQQEELETLRVSESIKHANLQELARLVLESDEAITDLDDEAFRVLWESTVEFARGVAQ